MAAVWMTQDQEMHSMQNQDNLSTGSYLFLTGNSELIRVISIPDDVKELYLDMCDKLSDIVCPLPLDIFRISACLTGLTHLPPLPPKLHTLQLSGNKAFIGLPDIILPLSLEHLDVSDCGLSVLPKLPSNLLHLNCTKNQITHIDVPSNLETLLCKFNNITTLILAHNHSLTEICATDNKIRYIDTLPETLTLLDISRNEMSSIPYIPNSIINLFISNNRITHLPPLPTSLENLHCDHNPLLKINAFPCKLATLFASHTNIMNIPPLTPKLVLVDVSYSKLYIPPINTANKFTMFMYANTPLYDMVGNLPMNTLTKLNKFRELYFTLKFKAQFRKLLWEHIREKVAMERYAPSKLNEILYIAGDDGNLLDTLINAW